MGIEGFRKTILKQMGISASVDDCGLAIRWTKILDWIQQQIIINGDGTVTYTPFDSVQLPPTPCIFRDNVSPYFFYYFDFNCFFYFSKSNSLSDLVTNILDDISDLRDPSVDDYYNIVGYSTILFFYLVVSELGILKKSSDFFVAIDGVPPRAKHMGKRKKWLRRAILDNLKHQIVPRSGFLTDAKVFTYGTTFMEHFNHRLQHFSEYLKGKYGVSMTISDSNIEGEGEIKIMTHLSRLTHISGKSIFIWSPDSDIIIHSILAYLRFVRNTNIDLFQFEPCKGQLFVIKIAMLYATFIDNFKYKPELEGDSVIRDICLLFALIGNDFIPSFPCLLKNHWYELLRLTYHKYVDTYGSKHFISSRQGIYRIKFDNLFNYLQILEEFEPILLREQHLYHNLENYREFWFYWQKLLKSSKNDQDKINQLKDEVVLKYGTEHELFLVILLITHKTQQNIYGDIVSIDHKLDYVNLCDKKKQFNYLLTYFHEKSSYQCYPDRLMCLVRENPDLILEEILINNNYMEYHDLLSSEWDCPNTRQLVDKDGEPKQHETHPDNQNGEGDCIDKCRSYMKFLIWYIEYYYNLITVDNWYYEYETTPLVRDLVLHRQRLNGEVGSFYNSLGTRRKRVDTIISREQQISRMLDVFTYTGDNQYVTNLLTVMFNNNSDFVKKMATIVCERPDSRYIKQHTEELVSKHRDYFLKFGLVERFPEVYGCFKIEISLLENSHHQFKIIDRHKRLIQLSADFDRLITRSKTVNFLREHLKFTGLPQLYLYPKRSQHHYVLVPVNYSFVNQILHEKSSVFTCLLHIPKVTDRDSINNLILEIKNTNMSAIDLKLLDNNTCQLPRISNGYDYLNFIRISRKKQLWGNFNQLVLLENFYKNAGHKYLLGGQISKNPLPNKHLIAVCVEWEAVGDHIYLTMSHSSQKIYVVKYPFDSKEWMAIVKRGIIKLINERFCYQGINYEIVGHSKPPLSLKYVYLDWGEQLNLDVEVIHRKKLPDKLKFQIKYQKYQNLVTFYHGNETTVSVDNENAVTNEYLKGVVLNYLFQHYYIQKTPIIRLYRPNLEPILNPKNNTHGSYYLDKNNDTCSGSISDDQANHNYFRHKQFFDIAKTRAVNVLIDIETYLP